MFSPLGENVFSVYSGDAFGSRSVEFGSGLSGAGGRVAEMVAIYHGGSPPTPPPASAALPWAHKEPGSLEQGPFSVFQLFETKKNTKNRHRKVTIYSFAGNQRNRCSTFRVKRNQTIYWQEGLLVTFDGGYLR